MELRIKTAAKIQRPDAVRALSREAASQGRTPPRDRRRRKARQEIAAIEKILREKYADIVADLSIGSPMPALVSEDLDGQDGHAR